MSPRTMRAAARGRVEAELSKFQRDAWTGAAAVWREQQRQCLRGSERPHKTPFQIPGFVSVASGRVFLARALVTTSQRKGARCSLEGEHSSLRSTRGPTAAPPHACTHHRLRRASDRLPPPVLPL
eukprot:scaffold61349_cov62-Phaeocystis_antarctica.AAC.3